MATLFKVNKNLNRLEIIEEIEYIRKTDSFYWKTEKYRDALETTYTKCFETKQEAVDYIGEMLRRNLSLAESNFNNAESELEKYKQIYKDFIKN